MIGVLGLAGWTGWPIDISLYITFGLVGVATVADVVHVLSGYLFFHRKGQNHKQTAGFNVHFKHFDCNTHELKR